MKGKLKNIKDANLFNIYIYDATLDKRTYILTSDRRYSRWSKRSVFNCAASIQGRLLLRDLVLSCGFYLRAPSIHDFTVHMTLH